MKLEISLFRFDYKSDYLPYYTKHFLKIKSKEFRLLDLLNLLNEENEFAFKNCKDFDLVINKIYVKASISLEELTKKFGKELVIEPISIKRAYKDLLINEEDFINKLEILDGYIDTSFKHRYEELKRYYYASNTFEYYNDYIGDSLLILAYEIIEQNPNLEDIILKKLKEYEISASYHTCLENRIYNFDNTIKKKIRQIQIKLGFYEILENQNFRVNKTLKLDFKSFHENYEIKHDFSNFNMAYYSSNQKDKYIELINKLKIKHINIDSINLDLAKNTFNINPEITFNVANKILLDAFDNNCDFLLVDNEEEFYIFDYNRKEFEKISGREVIIPIIHINELQQLACGNFELAKQTLEKHCINPQII